MLIFFQNPQSCHIKKLSKNSPKFINELTEFPATLSLIRKKLEDNSEIKELEELIQEFLDKGGVIKQCEPMVRTDPSDITHLVRVRSADVGAQ